MTIAFPSSPTANQIYSPGGTAPNYIYNATIGAWQVNGTSLATVTTGAVTATQVTTNTLVLPTLNSTDPGVANTVWSSGGVLVQSGHTLTAWGGKNLIHNSMFRINQRGIVSITTASTFPADRWLHGDNNAGSRTVSTTALTDADRAAIGEEIAVYSLRIQTTGSSGSGDYEVMIQRMEDVQNTGGKTLTVSFWAKAASAGQPVSAGYFQSYGQGGSPSAAITTPISLFSLTTAWTRYSATFIVPSTAGKTFGTTVGTDYAALYLFTSAGSASATFASNIGVQTSDIQIWGVQLEFGKDATAFEHPKRALENVLCQRFYQIARVDSFGYATAGNSLGFAVPLVVPMRAAPTVSLSAVSYGNASGGLTVAYANSVFFYYTTTATGLTQTGGYLTASAEL